MTRSRYTSWNFSPTHPGYINLFHYTDEPAFMALTGRDADDLDDIMPCHGARAPEIIYPSDSKGGKDAHYGSGFYLTDINPFSMPPEKIANRLWQVAGRNMRHRVAYWLNYFVWVEDVQFCRKHVYRLPPESGTQMLLMGHGPTG